MNALKLAAGVIALADSALGLYLSFMGAFTKGYGDMATLMFWDSVVLVIVSLLCIYGVHYAFPLAAVLSAVLAGVAPLLLESTSQEVPLVVLSLLALVVSVLAFRSKSMMSEQANPMNLPVFG